MQFDQITYLPQLKWKAGECRALSTVVRRVSERVLPAFTIMPAGDFDVEADRVLSPIEHLQTFGRRLANNWGRRLAFVDGRLVDDELHAAGLAVHPLTELLERASLEGGNCAPVVTAQNSPQYLEAVARFVSRQRNMPICYKVSLSNLENGLTSAIAETFLNAIGTKPAATILLIDGGPMHFDASDVLIDSLIERIEDIAPPGFWLRVFWGCTSFPEQHGLKSGQVGTFPRHEWELYNKMYVRRGEFPVFPGYSDYALEYPSFKKPVKASPVAHLRYSTETDFVIARGPRLGKGVSYSEIHPVAQNLERTGLLLGPEFSAGDHYMDQLADENNSTGHAWIWRWASTDHHITLAVRQIARQGGEIWEETHAVPRQNEFGFVSSDTDFP